MKIKKKRSLRMHAYVPSSSTQRFKLASATAQGRRHEAEGVACQDAVAYVAKGKFAAIALADGAGTARHAARGASLCVDATLRHLVSHFDSLLAASEGRAKIDILANVRRAIRCEARTYSANFIDFACTLIFAITDGKTMLLGQIGDGRLGVRDQASGQWRPILVATKGEFFNETTFVTSRRALANFQLARGLASSISACLLMSDGAEESLFNRGTQSFAPAVDTIANWVADYPSKRVEAAIALQLQTLLRAKTFDDLSLVCMSRTTQTLQG
jgi:hypothetical protein